MTPTRAALAAALALIVAWPVAASPGGALAQHTRTAQDGAPPPPASIDQLAWLAGSWTGTGLGAEVTETYSAPLGGRITGHFAMADSKGGVAFTEIVDYVPHGASLAYRVRHFSPDMSGWEDGTGKPVVFVLVATAKDRWFFDGMTIERTGPDTLTMWVRMSGDGPDKAITEEPFHLSRAR